MMTQKPSLLFLRRMTTAIGVVQHSRFNVPDWRFGYCLDDNGRALALMTRWITVFPEDLSQVRELMLSYLSYVAFSERPDGRMRNFMTHDLKFQEESGSDDSFGRAIWGLGECAAQSFDTETQMLAQQLLERASTHIRDLRSPRAVAYVLLGLTSYYQAHPNQTTKKMIRKMSNYLLKLYHQTQLKDWRWFESVITYSNALLPLALLVSSQVLVDAKLKKVALESLLWLVEQTEMQKNGKLIAAPIGQNGWYERGGKKAKYDQQPVDVAMTILAVLKAGEITKDLSWITIAKRWQGWFYGQNSESIVMADQVEGWCKDGLNKGEANSSHGAETVIMYLMSELEMIKMEKLSDNISSA